jgi:hypothetical protein
MWQANWIDHRWRCPRCGVRPTLYLVDGTSMCLNCNLRWQAEQTQCSTGVSTDSAGVAEPTLEYPFTADELRRLAVYRRAVAAGFYTDDLPRLPLPLQPWPTRASIEP